MKRIILLITFLFSIFGHTSVYAQGVKIPEKLIDSSTIIPVKGRYGIVINQVITYGDFKTSKIKKGWTTTSTFTSNAASVSKSSQKFSFTQFAPGHMEAQVSCLGELSQADIEIIKNLFTIGTDIKNCFTGNIIISDVDAWEFIIVDPDSKPDNGSSSGFIRHGNDELIELFAIIELEGKKIPKFFQGTVYGFEFRLNGETIGTVSLYNKGAVIFRNGISDNLQLVIASLSTALLVKEDLRDQ